ncbi:MAG: tetratricopeptide repeat protein [Planctomycetota bacterium]|jgi:tetratricopeptide (TPR) repeat protein
MNKRLLILLLVAAPLLAQDVAEIQTAIKDRRYVDAAELAAIYEDKYPEYEKLDEVRYYGGVACNQVYQYVEAEGFLKRLREHSPNSAKIQAGTHLLAEVVYSQRKLDEAIKWWKLNLEAYENSRFRERWRFGIAEATHRAWDFKTSKIELADFLKDYPKSKSAPRIRRMQSDINPDLVVTEFIVQGYAGKFAKDVRFQKLVEALPGMLSSAKKQVEKRLGIESGKLHSIAIQFKDCGFKRGTNRAVANTICLDDKPLHLVTFYTEYMVVSEDEFRSRVSHELKHAVFRNIMGNRYLNLPKWVREGLAVTAADQLSDRTRQVVSNSVFGGRDPMDDLDGLDERSRAPADYIEDGLAFVYLKELNGKGAVKKFCEAIIDDNITPEEAVKATTGKDFDEFKTGLAKFTLKHMKKVLGKGHADYNKIVKSFPKAAGREKHVEWYRKSAIPGLKEWLDEYKDHALEPNVHYLIGKYSVWIEEFATGRDSLQRVIDDFHLTSSICDDAFGWICKSYDREKKTEEAKDAWGKFLRDYSWAKTAIDNQNRFDPAGPVTAEDKGED